MQQTALATHCSFDGYVRKESNLATTEPVFSVICILGKCAMRVSGGFDVVWTRTYDHRLISCTAMRLLVGVKSTKTQSCVYSHACCFCRHSSTRASRVFSATLRFTSSESDFYLLPLMCQPLSNMTGLNDQQKPSISEDIACACPKPPGWLALAVALQGKADVGRKEAAISVVK